MIHPKKHLYYFSWLIVPATQTDTPDLYKPLELMGFSNFRAMQHANALQFTDHPNLRDETRDMADAAIKAAIGDNRAKAFRLLLATVARYFFAHFPILPFPGQSSPGRNPILVPAHH